LVAGGLLLWGLSQLALGGSSSFGLSLGVMLFVGGCAAFVDLLQQTLAQLSVPEAQRGRAMGVWIFSIGMNLVGLMQVGTVTSWLGAPASLGVNGTLLIAGALVVLALAPSFRPRRRQLQPAA
jgi:hypothetical protein